MSLTVAFFIPFSLMDAPMIGSPLASHTFPEINPGTASSTIAVLFKAALVAAFAVSVTLPSISNGRAQIILPFI